MYKKITVLSCGDVLDTCVYMYMYGRLQPNGKNDVRKKKKSISAAHLQNYQLS